MKKPKHTNVLWILFSGMFQISAFTFGGGFVIASFIKKHFVDELGWIEESEMLDLIALGQSSPGAVAVNVAILVGWRVFGFLGMLVAALGTILPPMIILTVISFFYNAFATNRMVALVLRGMQVGVAALILSVALDLGKRIIKTRSLALIVLMVLAFVGSFVFRINVMFLILTALLIGLGVALTEGRRKTHAQ
ncbi:MAG: chromate transporter [Spirochaetales bacterium]|nr:chromate transporter [Candidatus Physcosoma equi]